MNVTNQNGYRYITNRKKNKTGIHLRQKKKKKNTLRP